MENQLLKMKKYLFPSLKRCELEVPLLKNERLLEILHPLHSAQSIISAVTYISFCLKKNKVQKNIAD